MQHSSVEKLFKDQTEQYSQRDQYKESPIAKLILKKLKERNLGRKIEICEFGGGPGQLLDMIQKVYPNTSSTNVEIVDTYKKFLVSKEIRYIKGSVLNSHFKDGSFDLLIMRNVIHHLVGENLIQTRSNQSLAIKELKRLLKPGGIIFIEELTNSSEFACKVIYLVSKINSKLKLSFMGVNPNTIIYFSTPKRLLRLLHEFFDGDCIIKEELILAEADLKTKIMHLGFKMYNTVFSIENKYR